MNIFEMIKEKFPNVKLASEKIQVEVDDLCSILEYLKITPELSFDMLLSIIAVDYMNSVELIYPVISTYMNERVNLSVNIQTDAQSVINLYPSAYFDECEIYDLFGVNFIGNNNLKRLLMPKSWIGHPLRHPLRKNYELKDKRLSWNG